MRISYLYICVVLATFIMTVSAGAAESLASSVTHKTPPAYTAVRAKSAVTIDGTLDDWMDVPPILLNQKNQVHGSKWTGPGDLNAKVYLQWDHNHVYLAVDVHDDHLDFGDSDSSLWMWDSVQFAFDARRQNSKEVWDGDDYSYQLGLVRSSEEFLGLKVTDSSTAYTPILFRSDHNTKRAIGVVKEANVATKVRSDGYIIEASIPWQELNPIMPIDGKTCGFSIIVNDNDGSGREGWIAWTPGIGDVSGSADFGHLTFEGSSELELFGSTTSLEYQDNENVVAQYCIHSPRDISEASVECKVISPAGEIIDTIRQTCPLTGGLNSFSVTWPARQRPRGLYRIAAEIVPSNSTCEVRFVKESPLAAEQRIHEMQKRLVLLDARLKEAESRGISTQYERVSYMTIKTTLDFAPMIFDPKIRNRPDVAERMLDYAELLQKRTEHEVETILTDPSKAHPRVESLDLKKGITIRNGVFYNGDRPVILIGLMAAGPGSHYLKVIEESPFLGFNHYNIIAPAGPGHLLCVDGTVNKENLNQVQLQLQAAEKNNLVVDFHLNDHQLNGVLSKEYPDVYDKSRCDTGTKLGTFYGASCLENPNLRKILRRYLRVCIPAVKNSPALLCYDLGNESKYACSCPIRMKHFRAWLIKRYGGLARINKIWGTKLKSMSEIPPAYNRVYEPTQYGPKMYTPFYQEHPAARIDFVRFNQERLGEWFLFLKNEIRSMDAKTPTFVKLLMLSMPYQEYQLAGMGVNREIVSDITEIHGMDGAPLYIPFSDMLGKQTEKAYRNACFYDWMRSVAPDKPIMNGENLANSYDYGYVSPEAYRQAIWEEVLHGQAVTDIWIYAHPSSWVKSQYISRPEMMDSLGRASLDIRRLAPLITRFWSAPNDIAILYSTSSLAWSPNSEIHMYNWYMNLACNDAPVGFVTERTIRKEALERTKVLVVAYVDYLPDETYKAIRNFVIKGGTLLITQPCFVFDEYGRGRGDDPFLRACRQASNLRNPISFGKGNVYVNFNAPSPEMLRKQFDGMLEKSDVRRPIRVLGKDGLTPVGVETRTVPLESGRWCTYIINRSAQSVHIQLKSNTPIRIVRDRIREIDMPLDFELSPQSVYLLEISN